MLYICTHGNSGRQRVNFSKCDPTKLGFGSRLVFLECNSRSLLAALFHIAHDFLLVVYCNGIPISHRFQDTASCWRKIAISHAILSIQYLASPVRLTQRELITSLLIQESCASAKMTARCALYKWIEWAVAEIWPFEIIQDGGLLPTWIWCNRK